MWAFLSSKRRLLIAVAVVAVVVAAVAVGAILCWPVVASTGGRLTLLATGFLAQFAGAILVVRNVVSQEKLDRDFLAGLLEIERIRDEQKRRMDTQFEPDPPEATHAPSLGTQLGSQAAQALQNVYRGGYGSLPLNYMDRQREVARRLSNTPGIKMLREFSAQNFGDVLPKTHETITNYLRARAQATTTDRWTGVILLFAGLAMSLLSGIVGTLA
ncbi:MAG: hypothetical protein INR66_12710 [Gordonia polyisoprenivorans]|nr:hypothetical protein [Gordonia polyisoprenivorans]